MLSTSSDVELQYGGFGEGGGKGGGVAFPSPVVTTGISGGRGEVYGREDGGVEEKGEETGRVRGRGGEIGVTTTVEQYYR